MKIRKVLEVVVFAVMVFAVATLCAVASRQSKTIKFQREQIEWFEVNLQKALDKSAISFAISPAIHNKVNSAFGSTKNVTLQYYFTIDGEAILVNKADSVYTILKEY